MSKNQKQKFLDLTFSKAQKQKDEFNQIENPGSFKSTLFSRGKKSNRFFTEDSKLYITPGEQVMIRKGINLDRNIKKWDSLSSRIVNDFVAIKPKRSTALTELLERRYALLNESINEASQSLAGHFSLLKLWNLSIVGSILFGMVTMTFIYRYLGQGAAADQVRQDQTTVQTVQAADEGKVLGAQTSNDAEAFTQQVLQIEQANDQQALEKQIRQMVKGYPIEDMVPYIAKQDRTVAAFLIGIAKKESGWGQHHPVLNDQDCYNYWGFRGQRKLMGTGGHTCFNSPQDAVETVAARIKYLVSQQNLNTPAKMVDTWKCGTSCASDPDAQKWISDVTMYFNKLNND